VLFVAFSLPAPDVQTPPTPTPEPGTMVMMGCGIAAAIIFAKLRKSRR
jgi:hypothetical protein